MRHKATMAMVLIAGFGLLAGCPSIPEGAAALSEQVGVGIERMQEENEKVIRALADVQRGIVDEAWERMYRDAEAQYRHDEGLAAGDVLTEEHRIDVATAAAGLKDDLLAEIKAKEDALLVQSQQNAQQVKALNDTVQDYLVSLEQFRAAREKARELVEQIVGVDVSELGEAAKKALEGIGSP